MSKGLKLTLLTVVVALMGTYAMAMAPVILDVPSPIIGDENSITNPNLFVFPDAIDLESYVTDDGGAANVVWSYWIEGTAKYNINGVAPLNLASDDPITPGAKSIQDQVLQSELDEDTDVGTVTFRNVNLSPFGGPNGDPAGTGIIDAETQVVTLFASDGSTYSQKEIMVYTDDNGIDRMSGTGDFVPVMNLNFVGDDNGFNSNRDFGTATVTVGAQGVCVEVPALGVNVANWATDYGYMELVANQVYRMRMTVNGSQTTAGLGPLWDLVLDNFGQDPAAPGTYIGANCYLSDWMFLDNEGGANAAGSVGRTSFEAWFTPLPVSTAQWNDATTGAFIAANDDINDARLILRVLDVGGAGYGGELDLGAICLQTLTIDRTDVGSAVATGTPYNVTTLTNAGSGGNFSGGGIVGTAVNFASGAMTLSPSNSSTGWTNEIAYATPGDTVVNYGDPASLLDNWPIAWEADTLYQITMGVSAPNAAGASSPPDVIQLGVDCPSNEVIYLNSVTPGDATMNKIGTPKEGAPQTYTAFFYSHAESRTTIVNGNALRPRAQVMCATGLAFSGQATNMGGITIHSMTVRKVTF